MGYSNSCLAVRGFTEEFVLSSLGLEKTVERAGPGRRDWGCARVGDWTIVWSPRCEPRTFRDASSKFKGEVVLCDVEEHVMFVSASAFSDGTLSWRIAHDAQKARDHLAIAGKPPESFDRIRAEELARVNQDREVDFIFEIPVRMAQEVIGFRHDAGPTPVFNILRAVASETKPKWKFW